MKRLAYLVALIVYYNCSAQSYSVKKVNDDYVVTDLKGSEKFKNNIIEVLRDNNGLYWFRNITSISSFDGVNWKSYSFKTASGKNIPVRFNEIEVTDDGAFWLGSAEGMFLIDPASQIFIPVKQKYPRITGIPPIVNCIYKGNDNLLFISVLKDGFYILDWKSSVLKYIVIDSINKTEVPTDGQELDVTVDKDGNYWGLTKRNNGVWHYNSATGKISCSWKNELSIFPDRTYQGRFISGITYVGRDHSLWLSYGEGILEKVYLSNGKRKFYTFHDDLKVRTDTNIRKRYSVTSVKIDGENNEWTFVAGKYLVKLADDIGKFEYLVTDYDFLPLGKLNWFLFENNDKAGKKIDNLMWLVSDKGLSVLKKRNSLVQQIPFDTLSNTSVKPGDYENKEAHNTIFFEKGYANTYYLLQQDAGRPKLISLDTDLRIKKVLFNDEWKKVPAYFNPDVSSNSFYIAMLRPGIEPINFRTVVIKDFKVDLATFKIEDIDLNFSQRVWRYGTIDANGICWLFSNGYLYSYDPEKTLLDSIFICEPGEKGKYDTDLVKGFDYPTVLHKSSSTFWIDFIPTKELYKIDLVKRKIDKIIKPCFDKKDCIIHGVVNDLYAFDSASIYLQGNFGGMLINAKTDLVTDYSDLFKNVTPIQGQVGSGIYKNWICHVSPVEINMFNTVTKSQRKLLVKEDFKWNLSQFNSRPVVNDRGEMILMSKDQKGFTVFNLDSVAAAEKPGVIRFSLIKLDESELQIDSLVKRGTLSLKYNGYNRIHFRFSDYTLLAQDKIIYEYTLYNGGDTVWNRIEGEPELNFSKISPGNYQLLIRAGNGFGDYSKEVTTFRMSIIPPFTQTAWFMVIVVVLIASILYGLYRYRLRQIKKLQIVRNNIASDLHDDIGSTLNSISIYSEVAKQQAGKEVPALDLIGDNSRKIIENMSDIVWAINPENDSFEKIIIRMRSFAHQLLNAKKIEYIFEADEKLNSIVLPMQVRKNLYLVFKETITNLVKYSAASRVSILLKEENKVILLHIKDNGKGMIENPESQGNGLMNMKRRAAEIKASLNIESVKGEGTGIELLIKV